MRSSRNVETYYVAQYNGEFLYNPKTLTAVLLKFIIKNTKKQYASKRNRSSGIPFDIANRATTTSVGILLIQHFMHHPSFPQYELVVPVGSRNHEACIFFRMHKGSMQAIYYNPNYSSDTKGVQFSQTAKQVLNSIGLTTIHAFHSTYGNANGLCSLLTWEQIFYFVQNGDSPFDNKELNLTEYNHINTPHSYNKYNKTRSTLEFFSIWKDLNEMLIRNNANVIDKLRIAKLLNEVFHKLRQ